MTLLIFDLDGTLVDCKALHQVAFRNAVLQQVPDAEFDDEDVEGLPTTEKIKVLQSKGFPVTMELDKLKRDWTRQHIDSHILFDPDLHSAIARLDKQGKYKMAVCSNSRNEFVLKCLSILDLWQFDLVFSRDHGRPKPNPWMFQECMSITNTPAGDTYIFEDSPVGIQAAEASGANVIEILDSEDLIRILNSGF